MTGIMVGAHNKPKTAPCILFHWGLQLGGKTDFNKRVTQIIIVTLFKSTIGHLGGSVG